MGNNKESADRVLDIVKEMAKDDNKGLIMSLAVAKVEDDPMGSIVGFGVGRDVGDAVSPLTCGMPSKYMVFAFFIDREEYLKYKNK